ncbi:MAG: carboxypeptidase-like regulatory domain-containing protein [bacterium]|nr:carboxypeptidase-like regulatory domain-containing protein [bacterium]
MHRVLIILLAVALLAVGLGSYLLLSGDEQPVEVGSGNGAGNHAHDREGPRAAPAAGQLAPNQHLPGSSGAVEPGTRDATGATASPARLRIEVATPRAELAVDLELLLWHGPGPAITAATNAQGIATFVVPLPDGPTTAFISAAAGQPLAVDLAPGGQFEAVLRLEAVAFAAGRVFASDGRLLPDAELVVLADHARHPGEPDPARRPLRIGRTRADGTFRVPLFGAGYLGARHRDFGAASMQHTLTLPRDPSTGIARVDFELGTSTLPVVGLVVDAAGRAVASARVRLSPCQSGGTIIRRAGAPLPGAPVDLVTDRRGRFEARGLPPGPCYVEVLAAATRPAQCAAQFFDVPARERGDWRIQTSAAATVFGTAGTASGSPLAARVQIGAPGDLLFCEASTPRNGEFELFPLPAGRRRLVAQPLGSPGTSDRREVTTILTLGAGRSVRWDPRFPPAGAGLEVHGRVRDEHDRPLANWTIVARQHESARTVQVMTDLSGSFRIPSERDARFDLLAYAPNAAPTGFAAATRRDVTAADGPTLLVVPRNAAGATVRGQLRTRDGEPVPGKISCWHNDRQQTVHLAADEHGAFEFTNVPPGTAVLLFTYERFVAPARRLDLQPAQQLELGTITMAEGASVSGRVTRMDGSSPDAMEVAIITGTDGQHLPGGYVAGEYRFGSVPAGRHRLLVSGPGIAAAAVALDVTAGTDLQQDIRVARGIKRTIRVHSPLGDAGWITLALRQPGQPFTAMLGQPLPANRLLEFEACMTAGTWQAVAWDSEGREARANVTFTAGATAPIQLVLKSR